MSLCVFALIASEFMPVSLLTPMAADLQVSEGMVGQGIAISGLFAVLTNLSISTLAGGMPGKGGSRSRSNGPGDPVRSVSSMFICQRRIAGSWRPTKCCSLSEMPETQGSDTP